MLTLRKIVLNYFWYIWCMCKCLRSQTTRSGKEESTQSVINCMFVLFTFVISNTMAYCLWINLSYLIMNNRLEKYADNFEVINSTQNRFRKNYSTPDNLFILKSLIDIVQSNKKKLYCCFVDFKQAFDSVWRVGLWNKLVTRKSITCNYML